ncbi:MAG TPA: hypothetical protein VLF93_07200 [Candidatus Saccharimonadales bacterium]|nr:hypothetical protein [Candidatus Saccharimonadales bacterium]
MPPAIEAFAQRPPVIATKSRPKVQAFKIYMPQNVGLPHNP